jgi:hypothetical protein
MLQLLVFLTNYLTAAENVCRNVIHCQRRVPKTYEKVKGALINNNVTWFYIIWTITWYLAMVMGDNEIDDNKKICVKCWRFRLP